MTIEKSDVIDSIGLDKEDSNKVILKIFDHLEWESEYEHLLLLQEKINAYLRFIESGEIFKAYKKAEDQKKFLISIDFAVSPVSNAIKFLNVAAHTLKEIGAELEYTVDGSDKQYTLPE